MNIYDETINFEIDTELKKDFAAYCKAKNKAQSKVIRGWIDNYVTSTEETQNLNTNNHIGKSAISLRVNKKVKKAFLRKLKKEKRHLGYLVSRWIYTVVNQWKKKNGL